jgi:hypothetical protein
MFVAANSCFRIRWQWWNLENAGADHFLSEGTSFGSALVQIGPSKASSSTLPPEKSNHCPKK